MRFAFNLGALALAGLVALSACGGAAAPSAAPVSSSPAAASPSAAAPASASAKPAASPAASAKPAASAGASAKPAASGSAAASPAPSLPPVAKATLSLAKPLPALNPPVTVKARVGNSLTTAPFWYAIEKGYFDQLGLKFEEVNITNSIDIVGPLTQGQIDIAGAGFSAGLYTAVARGVEVAAVADNGQLDTKLAGSAAVVKKGALASYGQDWCSLKGKKIGGIDPGGGLQATLAKALASCKLTLKDVDAQAIPLPTVVQAVVNGAVDVGFAVEPFVSAGVKNGTIDLWRPLDDGWNKQQMNVLLYSPQFVKNRDAGLRFMVAYVAGARDYRRAIEGTGDKNEMGVVLAKHLAIKDPKAYGDMIMMGVDPNGQVNLPALTEEVKIFQDAGQVQPGTVSTNWVTDEFRTQALDYLGPYKP